MVIRTSNAKFPQRSQDLLKWEGKCSSVGELVHKEKRSLFCVRVPFVISKETQPGMEPVLE